MATHMTPSVIIKSQSLFAKYRQLNKTRDNEHSEDKLQSTLTKHKNRAAKSIAIARRTVIPRSYTLHIIDH